VQSLFLGWATLRLKASSECHFKCDTDWGLPVIVRVDAASKKGEMPPIWRFFGADEPNYAYMKDGRKLIAELGQLRPQQVYFERTTC